MNDVKAICLRADRIFDGESFQPGGFVAVSGDRVESLGSGCPEGAQVLDLGPGSTLLPGLINAHSHVSIVPALGDQLGQLRLPAAEQLSRARQNMRRELESGVTTLRVMGQEWGVDFRLYEEIQRGLTAGPNLLCAGQHITRAGHHGHAITAVSDWPSFERLALDNIRKGARHLKIFVSGGVSSDTRLESCPFTLFELRKIVQLARSHDLPIAAHAIGGPGIDLALEAGIDSIEHAAALTAEQLDRLLKWNRVAVGTFSILFHPLGIEAEARKNPQMRSKIDTFRPRVEQAWRRILKSEARIAIGTDSVHGAMHFEVEMLLRLGASPERALAAATSAAATLCRLPDRGRIRPGMRADLVAFRGDLLAPGGLRHPILVMKAGRLVQASSK